MSSLTADRDTRADDLASNKQPLGVTEGRSSWAGLRCIQSQVSRSWSVGRKLMTEHCSWHQSAVRWHNKLPVREDTCHWLHDSAAAWKMYVNTTRFGLHFGNNTDGL